MLLLWNTNRYCTVLANKIACVMPKPLESKLFKFGFGIQQFFLSNTQNSVFGQLYSSCIPTDIQNTLAFLMHVCLFLTLYMHEWHKMTLKKLTKYIGSSCTITEETNIWSEVVSLVTDYYMPAWCASQTLSMFNIIWLILTEEVLVLNHMPAVCHPKFMQKNTNFIRESATLTWFLPCLCKREGTGNEAIF